MSFQAPETDADVSAGFTAPEGDLDPPKSVGGFMDNVLSNAAHDLNPVNIAKGLGQTAKTGLYDLPKAALESSTDLVQGAAKALTTGELPKKEDIENTPILKQTREMTQPIAKDPLGYLYKNPVDAALMVGGAAAPFLGAEGAGMAGAAEKAAPAAEGLAPLEEMPKAAPREGLPVVQPGAKTGDPHALFAYNDEFGPGGKTRSIYNVFGDPEHPAIKQVGHGSSLPQAELEKAGIPITGREPRSVGKFEPIQEPPQTPPPSPASAPSSMGSVAEDAAAKAQEVKNYISRGYQGFAKKPGAIADVADYVQEKSQMMSAQQMGFTPLQNRQLGATPAAQLEAQRAIGQYGLDSGIVSPVGGLRHMVKTNETLLNQAGQTLGDIRRAADKVRDPTAMPIDPLQQIRGRWDKVFTGAERSDEAAQYERALKIVEEHPATFEGMANAATALNKAANKANKLNQPHGAFTDVANTLSHLENDRIRALLPEKAATYDKALKEFGINKKIEAALRRKVGGEVKRMGPGSLTSNFVQKGLDEIGYRVGAKAANKLSTSIKGNPSVAGNLPSLFREFANHVDDTAGEVSGMSQGGAVPDAVRNYVQSRAG